MREDRRSTTGGVFHGSDVVVRNDGPMFGERAKLVEVRRKQHERRLFFETDQELADRLRDRQTIERSGSAAHFVDQE
jgi:hypothetical protein